MKTYLITAKSVGFLSKEIKANSQEDALKKLDELLSYGEMPEVDGWIENEEAEEVIK